MRLLKDYQWANDGVLQANDDKMLVNDGQMLVNGGEMLVNDGEMSIWLYTHFTLISLKLTSIRSFDHHWEVAPTEWRYYLEARNLK